MHVIKSFLWNEAIMATISILIYFVLGLALLYFGADRLIRGSSSLALILGVSKLVIGLTVIAYGTSSPELFVSVLAAYQKKADLAIGNVIGSNIFNILGILGLCAIIRPAPVPRQVLTLEMPIVLAVSFLLPLLLLDGDLSHLDGATLFGVIILYTLFQIIYHDKRLLAKEKEPLEAMPIPVMTKNKSWGFIILGFVFLVAGAHFFINSALQIAKWSGLSEAVIGVTLVAIGTSLPELATSIVATTRGQHEISIGNIVGSNIFNIAGILGIAALIAPMNVNIYTPLIQRDIPIMIMTAAVFYTIILIRKRIDRLTGVCFLIAYASYTYYLL